MANKVYITITNERELNADFTLKEFGFCTNVYVNCNEIRAWIGEANNKEQLMELIGPKVFYDTLVFVLSEDEYNIVSSALECSDNVYWLGDEKFKALESDEVDNEECN